MPNQTAAKFGHPETLVRDYRHWCVLLRPQQVTLGALVLVCKDEARRFPEITAGAFSELAVATRELEAALSAFRAFEKINYLMLMMVDPDVHFHVVPRYPTAQSFDGIDFPDPGWPGPPDLAKAARAEAACLARLAQAIRDVWPEPAEAI